MERRNILFEAVIQGQQKDLVVNVPVEGNNVVTNEYCPQELLTGGLKFVTSINGETFGEFIADCNMQIRAMMDADDCCSRMDVHIEGLMAAVVSHINRCGRLIFGDLLIYVDCFSLLLKADGFDDAEIRKVYPRITKTIVDQYSMFLKNTINLAPLHQTPLYNILSALVD
jgi:hypothetical protein